MYMLVHLYLWKIWWSRG